MEILQNQISNIIFNIEINDSAFLLLTRRPNYDVGTYFPRTLNKYEWP